MHCLLTSIVSITFLSILRIPENPKEQFYASLCKYLIFFKWVKYYLTTLVERFWDQQSKVLIYLVPLSSFTALGKFLKPCVPQFPLI